MVTATPSGPVLNYAVPVRHDFTGDDRVDFMEGRDSRRPGQPAVGSEAFCAKCGTRTVIDIDQVFAGFANGQKVFRLQGKRAFFPRWPFKAS